MPIAWRISAPAPTEKASGSTPMMKAIEVIRIVRSLRPAASMAACSGVRPLNSARRELHDQDGILRREPHQHHEADLREDVVVAVRSATHL